MANSSENYMITQDKKNIYILNDPRTDLNLLSKILKERGYRVISLDHMSDFLNKLEEQPRLSEEETSGKREGNITQTNLTFREKQILRRIYKGYTSQSIARELKISRRTVESHRSNILQKTRARNTADLIRYTIEQGIIQSEGL
jgi:DNA-binding NarL/FixJ family response regulator